MKRSVKAILTLLFLLIIKRKKMVQVLKKFHKIKENKHFAIGEKVEFDAKTEKQLIEQGIVKKIVVRKKKK